MDLFAEPQYSGANQSNDKLTPNDKKTTSSASIINRFTSILIDEINDDTQEFETSIITLPKSPMYA